MHFNQAYEGHSSAYYYSLSVIVIEAVTYSSPQEPSLLQKPSPRAESVPPSKLVIIITARLRLNLYQPRISKRKFKALAQST
jgi:hypothetical protein